MIGKISRQLFSLFGLLIATTTLHSAHVDLDPTFGPSHTGIVTTAIGTTSAASSIKIYDNKLIAAGTSDNSFATIRYNLDGTPDTSFGTGGVVTTAIGDGASATSLVIQPADGKPVVAGIAVVSGASSFAVARYTSAGALDTTFSGDGIATTTLGDGAGAFGVDLQSDGSVVTAGVAILTGSINTALIKYTSSGALDSSFGTGGVVSFMVGDASLARAVVVQTDDQIVTAGTAIISGVRQFVVTRHNTDGSFDTSFGTSGVVTTAIGSSGLAQANAVALQADGSIVVAGYALIDGINQFAIVRYDSNGDLDTGFGIGGIVVTPIGSDAQANAVAIQTDGSIVVAGVSESNYALARYDSSGTLDSTFGTGGIIVTELATEDAAQSVVIQSDGYIVATGNIGSDFGTARYFSSNAPIITISNPADGSTVLGNTTPINGGASETGLSVEVSLDGDVITTTTTSSTGYWDAGTSPVLVNGSHTITVRLLDGVTELATASSTFTANSTPEIDIVVPADGSTITTNTTPINGVSTRAGLDVNVYVDSSLFTTTTTDSEGDWDAGTSGNLTNGSHTVSVELVDGGVIATDSNTFTVNSPRVITITSPTNNAIVGTSTVTISGTSSEASTRVVAYIDSVYFARTTTAVDGTWSVGTSSTLGVGDHSINAEVTDSAGHVLASATNTITVTP